MRQPCFLNIWRDCDADTGFYQFSDGSIYQYGRAGDAANARSAMINDPHGTWFNFNDRIATGGSGYTKIATVPSSAQQIYAYPPYDQADPGPCPCAGQNTDPTALTWTGSNSGGGTVTVTGSGENASFSATSVTFPLVQFNSSNWCKNTPTVISITVKNTSSVNGVTIVVTNSQGDFNYSVTLNAGQSDTRNVTWGAHGAQFQTSWQHGSAAALAGNITFTP